MQHHSKWHGTGSSKLQVDWEWPKAQTEEQQLQERRTITTSTTRQMMGALFAWDVMLTQAHARRKIALQTVVFVLLSH